MPLFLCKSSRDHDMLLGFDTGLAVLLAESMCFAASLSWHFHALNSMCFNATALREFGRCRRQGSAAFVFSCS